MYIVPHVDKFALLPFVQHFGFVAASLMLLI